jgi:hypothetical protein
VAVDVIFAAPNLLLDLNEAHFTFTFPFPYRLYAEPTWPLFRHGSQSPRRAAIRVDDRPNGAMDRHDGFHQGPLRPGRAA